MAGKERLPGLGAKGRGRGRALRRRGRAGLRCARRPPKRGASRVGGCPALRLFPRGGDDDDEDDDDLHSVDCLEKAFAALQRKIEADFSQVEGVQRKVKALSIDWEERHQRLKVEQEKVAELEAQIKLLNTKQEEALASLQADVLHAAAQIQEKEGLAEQLRAEVASLEERVRVACQEAAESAAELEKGAHEARLALEASLQQLAREDSARQTLQAGHETLLPHLCERFPCGPDAEQPGMAEGAEASAGKALQGQAQGAGGGLLEEADPRATRLALITRWVAAASSSGLLLALSRLALTPRSHRSGKKLCSEAARCFKNVHQCSGLLSGKGFCLTYR
ncbi:uncharacterized protein LOC134507141 [Candoia aspera]|uniref:uncharacterized protein LOC134507141 n=1 Tax=Candoia aspera TaxID=51853 RepID=UPI002FD7D896